MSYASIASRHTNQASSTAEDHRTHNSPSIPKGHAAQTAPSTQPKRSPSPSHIPQKQSQEENVYILTLHMDPAHHQRMTQLRTEYFPKRINKLEAHLTLFHALPESKLASSITPVIEAVASKTTQFKLHAAKPFKLKRGIAISVPKHEGGKEAQNIHRMLQRPWREEGFLSDQDAGGCRVHYTIMNKVDDEREVETAFEEVQRDWKGDWGVVEGLGLYRYDRGWWRWERKFEFEPVVL